MAWYCGRCGKELDKHEVSATETHDRKAGGCGGSVYWERYGRITVEKGAEYGRA